MDEGPDKLEALFDAALELPPQERSAYLAKACGEDEQLRQRLERLLRNLERAGNFLADDAGSPGGTGHSTVTAEKPGDRIGRYKLLEQIGEGGCGVVYMAEQEEPVRRRVALKIIKLGMDTRSVIARFEAERQALAIMDHPNIAKVHDAGATESGRPYFVMELVRGTKITDYCDEKSLPTAQRLDLFVKVSQAVQHAHQKGIIHRDLKPSNILVTVNDSVAVPKIIDFGIAKATTDQRLTDKTVFTAFEQFIGTPAYMSPEQAELTSLDVDTRSDIYSLGVLLYELLTIKTPFDSKELLQAGLDEMRRTIREKEPLTPSTRVSTMHGDELTTTAKRRGLEPPKLISQLRGDLDWIVMKCLEKDRARRYETANGLAMDIQRHLSNEPVTASPPSAFYRLQKVVRRNQLLFAAAGAVALALVLGLGLSTWLFLRERAGRREQARLGQQAQTEAALSKQVARMLQDMLAGVGPSVALGRDTALLREILDKTAERIDKELTNFPKAEIELRDTLADTYHELGLYTQMDALARRNLALARACFGEENAAVAQALFQLGRAQRGLENGQQAEVMHRQALIMRKRVFGEEHLEVAASLHHLAGALDYQWKWAESEQLYRQAVAMRRKLLGDQHSDVAESLHGLASMLMRQAQPFGKAPISGSDATSVWRREKLTEAENLMRQSLAIKQKVYGNENPALADPLNTLAIVLDLEGKFADEEELFRQAWTIRRKFLGDEHPQTIIVMRNLAYTLRQAGKSVELEELCRQMLALKQKLLGNLDQTPADSLLGVAVALDKQRKFADAEDLYRAGLAKRRKLLGDEDPSVTQSVEASVVNLLRQEKFSEAHAVVDSILMPTLETRAAGVGLLKIRGTIHVLQGARKEAVVDFKRALELIPSDHVLYCSIIPLLAASGELVDYRHYCELALAKFAGTKDVGTADRVAKACLILPSNEAQVSAAWNLADTAAMLNTHPTRRFWGQFCKGLAEYRRGNFENAASLADQALAQAQPIMVRREIELEVEGYALLAMSRYQLGQRDEACLVASKAADLAAHEAPDLSMGGGFVNIWQDVLYGQTLLKEAQALIEGPTDAGH